MGVESKELILNVLEAGSFSIRIRNEAEIHYDCQKGRVTLTRHRLDDGSVERRRVDVSHVHQLHLFLDQLFPGTVLERRGACVHRALFSRCVGRLHCPSSETKRHVFSGGVFLNIDFERPFLIKGGRFFV